MSLDQYFTGEETAKRLVAWANLSRGDRVLEPSAGDGGIVRHLPLNVRATALELDPALAARLRELKHPCLEVEEGDFLEWGDGRTFDAAVMNPPYSSVENADALHVMRAARLCQRVVALVRTNFLHGVKRYNALHRWTEIYRMAVCARRPPFYGPDDAGHTARHDYMAVELGLRTTPGGERPKKGALGVDAEVDLEFWL